MKTKNEEIIRQRLFNQLISYSRFNTPAEVVSWLGAIQAQDYAGAKWSIGIRLPSVTANDIELAIADKALIRTWMMRGTLHLIAKADIRWMLELLAPHIIANSTPRYRRLELDDSTFRKGKELFLRELRISKQLTRVEMYTLLEKGNISTTGQRGYHISRRAAQDGLICFGPQLGKEQTFVLLDEWAPDVKGMERDLALAELAMRYYTSHGPATLHDFVWWSGCKVSDARAGLDGISSKLIWENINGQIYWMPSYAPNMPEIPQAQVLPAFDEYIVGYKERAILFALQHTKKIFPGSGVFKPTIVINGRIVGIWRAALHRDELLVSPHPFALFNAAEESAFIKAVELYGKFLEKSIIFI